MNSLSELKSALQQFVHTLYGQSINAGEIALILNVDPQKTDFGDLSSNCAMILAKPLGKAPRVIAQEIIDGFKHPLIAKIEIAGPGFLNFFLTLDAIKQSAQELFDQQDLFFKNVSTLLTYDQYNIEFVSANPTGPLHLGHGRGAIIGDVLTNILRFTGYSVTKEHYINDAGVQMNKLGNSLKVRCQQELGSDVIFPEDGYQGLYLKTLAQELVEKNSQQILEKDDQFFIEYAYKTLLAEQQETLKSYGITFDVWFSEKTLHTEAIIDALNRLDKAGVTYRSEGALWFRSTDYGDDKDRVLKKEDGSYTYVAADAAYLCNKVARGFKKLILILGQDHHSYPKRLDGIRRALGFNDVTLECILYQLVSIKEDGKQLKLSKRAGRIVDLGDIIETVGVDIARFFYLNRKADAHLEFDLGLALSQTEENPVYYLQYAFVRTGSVLEKAAQYEQFKDIKSQDALYITDAEKLLVKKMVSLKELLDAMVVNHQVHLIAYYLLEVAHLFHNYYHHNRVIEPETVEQSRGRLLTVMLVQQTFDRCLRLMGLTRPAKM